MFLPFRTRRLIQTAARGPKNPLALVLLAGALALLLWGAGPHRTQALTAAGPVVLADDDDGDDDGDDLGAFTCDFGLPGDFPLAGAVPILERDRLYMSARPGFLHKHIPLSLDFATGNLFSGGRYLFDSVQDAEDYKVWIENDYILDGVEFFNRPYFLNPECHAWSVIGAQDFGDIHTRQIVVRTERWTTPQENQRVWLKALWPAIQAEAQRRGLTSVWLLYNKQERLVSLVYFADRVAPPDPDEPDFASLSALGDAPSLGQAFDAAGWAKRFDRTQWVLTIWFPFKPGDRGEPSVWPNSPPFPAP
jgi:hypothetical protein